MSETLPTLTLSIRQPWAWLIVHGWKDIENRDWPLRYRGPILIHAGKTLDPEAWTALRDGYSPCNGRKMPVGFVRPDHLDQGGIVGVTRIVDCVSRHSSPWFVGQFGFVLDESRPLPFMPCRGALGFFRVTYVEPRRPVQPELIAGASAACA